MDNIPENEFYVNVDILNLNEKRDVVVVLATYDQNGKMLNICSATADSTAESRSSNIRVENPGGFSRSDKGNAGFISGNADTSLFVNERQ